MKEIDTEKENVKEKENVRKKKNVKKKEIGIKRKSVKEVELEARTNRDTEDLLHHQKKCTRKTTLTNIKTGIYLNLTLTVFKDRTQEHKMTIEKITWRKMMIQLQ